MRVIEYNKINADAEQQHRIKLKSSTREGGYKRQQAENMEEYKKKQKALRIDMERKEKVKARKTRHEVQIIRDMKANGESIKQEPKKKRGRKLKPNKFFSYFDTNVSMICR